jgi:hypothetical protein
VIAWTSAEQDGSSWGIYAQRFSAAGVAVGPEVRVNTATAGEQSYPQVAGLSDGGYVITWQDPNGNDLSGWGVFAQRYDAAGSAEGSAFVVSTTTLGYQLHSVSPATTRVSWWPGRPTPTCRAATATTSTSPASTTPAMCSARPSSGSA